MKIYNTLTKQKEEFVPIEDGKVKMYVCGPTVYNFFHVGNARPFVVFDTMRRYLEYSGYEVNFVQNFTDVDDKIINKAREEGLEPSAVSQRFIEEYFADARALNVMKATTHPKVSETMEEIMIFIEDLVDKGYAYAVDGDVYYRAREFGEYGKLSKQNVDELESGARIMIGEKKEDPLDFALWKARKSDDEISWTSPWGEGRPGWHIECSVMSRKFLGDTIDIHAGGQDLIFPHHENEIAQSEAHNDKPFVRYWMHNGYITVGENESEKVKMSKSAGNFFTVRDILKEFDGEVIRFFLLSGHYRNPINFNRTLMEQAKNGLKRIENALVDWKHIAQFGTTSESEIPTGYAEDLEKFRQQFKKAMDDDLNTADGISAIFEMISQVNSRMRDGGSKEYARKAVDMLRELTSIVGLLQKEGEDGIDKELKTLIEERATARKNKDFARADEIRDVLKARGITLKDTPQGVQVIRADG